MMKVMRLITAVFTAAVLSVVSASSAAAAERPDVPGREITRWEQTYVLNEDGSASVALEFDFDFGNDPGHGPYLTVPVRQGYDDEWDRVYRVSAVSASSPSGAPADVYLEEGRNTLAIRIGDEDVDDVAGVQTYVVRYRIEHVMNSVSGGELTADGRHDEFYWNAVGADWTIPISDVEVTVEAPVEPIAVACYTGAVGGDERCADAQAPAGVAQFRADYAPPGTPVTVVAAYPAGAFDTGAELVPHSDVKRAFGVTPWTVGVAAVILAAGLALIFVALRRTGVDRQFAGLTPGLLPIGDEAETAVRDYRAAVAVRYEPPRGMRPGQLGTLLDEKADPRDVTATLVDLAVRGYLRIEEAGEISSGLFSERMDYRLVKLKEADSGLVAFERTLFEALFANRTEVTLSDLKTTFASSMAQVQGELYEDVTTLGWFRRNPKSARGRWAVIGMVLVVVGIIATVVLAQETRWALVPTPLVVLGLVMLITTRHAPARTARGTAALEQARGFKLYLETAEARQIRFEEASDIFSRYLPFAIAFGVADKWASTFAQLAREGVALEEPAWYGGLAYGAFWAHSADLGARMDGFASLADAAMSAPTSGSSGGSGFSGGGFSGGGGGGGGGGGW